MTDDDVDEIAELWGIGEAQAKPSATIHELKPPPKKEHQTGKSEYAGLMTKDKVYAFTIVSQSPRLEYSFFYQNLVQLVVTAPEADFLSVMTSSAFIRISGRNLKPIATALKLRTCDTITQYSPELFLAPTDTTAPFVETVEVTTPDPQSAKKNYNQWKGYIYLPEYLCRGLHSMVMSRLLDSQPKSSIIIRQVIIVAMRRYVQHFLPQRMHL